MSITVVRHGKRLSTYGDGALSYRNNSVIIIDLIIVADILIVAIQNRAYKAVLYILSIDNSCPITYAQSISVNQASQGNSRLISAGVLFSVIYSRVVLARKCDLARSYLENSGDVRNFIEDAYIAAISACNCTSDQGIHRSNLGNTTAHLRAKSISISQRTGLDLVTVRNERLTIIHLLTVICHNCNFTRIGLDLTHLCSNGVARSNVNTRCVGYSYTLNVRLSGLSLGVVIKELTLHHVTFYKIRANDR